MGVWCRCLESGYLDMKRLPCPSGGTQSIDVSCTQLSCFDSKLASTLRCSCGSTATRENQHSSQSVDPDTPESRGVLGVSHPNPQHRHPWTQSTPNNTEAPSNPGHTTQYSQIHTNTESSIAPSHPSHPQSISHPALFSCGVSGWVSLDGQGTRPSLRCS